MHAFERLLFSSGQKSFMAMPEHGGMQTTCYLGSLTCVFMYLHISVCQPWQTGGIARIEGMFRGRAHRDWECYSATAFEEMGVVVDRFA